MGKKQRYVTNPAIKSERSGLMSDQLHTTLLRDGTFVKVGRLRTSAGAIEGHFEGKTPREGHQRGLVLARQCPGSPGTSNPEETALPRLPVS